MPKIPEDAEVEVKLDGAAGRLQGTLTDEQRRGLFEHPGQSVVAIVEFRSTTYTGHADDEQKPPQVKLRVGMAEAAQDDEQAEQVLNVARAMMRRRRMQSTLDELGPGSHDAEQAVADVLAAHPSPEEFEEHLEHRGGSRIEQHG